MKGAPGEPGTGGPIGKRLDFLPCCSHFINECHSLPVSDCYLSDSLWLLSPGSDGQQGFPGNQGTKGWPGIPGESGKHGQPGIPGQRGTHTHTHKSTGVHTQHLCLIIVFDLLLSVGFPGLNGILGLDGLKGEKGIPGLPGQDNLGTPGVPGAKGTRGETGIANSEVGTPGSLGLKGIQGQPG